VLYNYFTHPFLFFLGVILHIPSIIFCDNNSIHVKETKYIKEIECIVYIEFFYMCIWNFCDIDKSFNDIQIMHDGENMLAISFDVKKLR